MMFLRLPSSKSISYILDDKDEKQIMCTQGGKP
jgi:hypothetical protein